MKILVVGLDCAAPELLLGEDLPNIRRSWRRAATGGWRAWFRPSRCRRGCACPPAGTRAPWASTASATGLDHSYDGMGTADARWFKSVTMWDQVAMQGGRSVIIGVPPSYPPRRVNGISVGCFLTPDPAAGVYTHPESLASASARWWATTRWT